MMNFQRGDLCPVKYLPLTIPPGTPWPPPPPNLAQATLLNITGYSFDDSILLFDVTNTGLNGAGTARIAGKGDLAMTVNADYDADASPWLPIPNIVKGSLGIILVYVGAYSAQSIRFIQFPVVVEKLHGDSTTTQQVKYSFDVKENVLAGLRVYPSV